MDISLYINRDISFSTTLTDFIDINIGCDLCQCCVLFDTESNVFNVYHICMQRKI